MNNDTGRLLAKRLRSERERAGLSREQLAEAVDLAPSYLAYLENSLRTPSLETLIKLAARLGVSAGSLLSDIPAGKPRADSQTMEQFAHLIRGKTPAQKKAIIKAMRALAKSL